MPSWIEQHCVIPDGFRAGAPFRLYDEQLRFFAGFYLVRGDAVWVPEAPILGPAFVHSRGLIVAPQKWGKNPMGAAQICAEAEGPALFAGWAGKDDGYACIDHECHCGWEYGYDPGEPMGMPWPTPLIQVTAFSEDQTDNTFDVLRPMIRKGPLADLIPNVGEAFIRLRAADDEARIEVVTSSEQSRLGARTTFVLEDQLEQWWTSNGMDKVANAQYRNLAGTGGRATLLANAWDPTQHSVAQREFESGEPDIWRQATFAPSTHACGRPDDEHDHFGDIEERRAILEHVYPVDHRREYGGHVDLASIDSEARKIFNFDPPQARRYFGNEIVEGAGKAFDITAWIARRRTTSYVPPKGALIVLGLDGSVRWDHFPIVATEVASGFQWPLHIWRPGGPGKEVPMLEVERVLEQAFDWWDVWRLYADPPYVQSHLDAWAGRWPDKIVKWETARLRAMAIALREWKQAITTGEMSHCAERDEWCALFTEHVGNAVRKDTGWRDDEGFLWTVEKPKVDLKIDSVLAATLSWVARGHALAAGALHLEPEGSAYDGLTEEQVLERMLV
ncbi:MAG: hypothetical protein V4515_12445 [Chloroflexota bacterium]